MGPRRQPPAWWQLYLLCGLILPVFIVEARLRISPTAHQMVEAAILAIDFGMIFRWIDVNSTAIAKEEPYPDWPPLHVRQVDVPGLSEDETRPQRPHLQFPPSGLKGMLDDKFQADWQPDDLDASIEDHADSPEAESHG